MCFSFFQKNFGFAVGGQRRSRRLDPHVAGLGQGAGPRLLRGSLCLKPLRISYCISQGAGWGLAEGFLVAALPRVQAAGAPLSSEERVRREHCEESKSEHLSLPTSSLVRVSWAPCPSQASALGAS